MSAAQHIADALVRLAVDYDLALADAEGDESVIALYLPDGWIPLVRALLGLIASESARLHTAGMARRGAVRDTCPGCGTAGFIIVRDIRTDGRRAECASCGQVTHVF